MKSCSGLFAVIISTSLFGLTSLALAETSQETLQCLSAQRSAKSAYNKAAKKCDSAAKKKYRIHDQIFKDLGKWEPLSAKLLAAIAAEQDATRKARMTKQFNNKSARFTAKHDKDMAKYNLADAAATKACGPDVQAAQAKVDSVSSCTN